ncbi:MAG: hypothetical protein AAFP84_19545, partial [Actinomycetota bacterium]
MRRFEVHDRWGLVLALPIFAYVTEGVITPVLYAGGPIPFFPLWFTGWHGLLSVLVLFVVVRRLAIERRALAMTALSVGVGLFWGTWLSTSWLPENLQDPELLEEHGSLVPMEPAEFGAYTAVFVAFLLGAHLLLDRAWPVDTTRLFARTERVLIAGLLLGAALWTVAAPWALPMFVVLCWIQFRLLRRHRDRRSPDQPTMLESLRGPASPLALLPLVVMAPVATAAYWFWWELSPSEVVLNWLYYGTIAVQTIAATALLVVAWRRTGRADAERASRPERDRSPAAV